MKKIVKKNGKKAEKYVNILGINVSVTDRSRVLSGVEDRITHNRKFYIVTPNPELVLMAQKNEKLKLVLNSADFAVPDGIGLAQAAKFLSYKSTNILITFLQGLFVGLMTIINRRYLTDFLPITKGRELFLDLVKLAKKNKWKVFLLGGLDNEAELVARKFEIRNSKFEIKFAGGSEVSSKLSKDLVDKINKFTPDLLFVAFGNPKQEIFAHEHISKLKVGGIMAVGGTFRYVAGLSKLPPKWMEKWGLEWVWRLITEPFRIKRIFNAFPIFPLKIWMSKLQGL